MSRPAALERGTQVRSRRAALKRRMAADLGFALDVIADRRVHGLEADQEVAREMPIAALLGAVAGIGDVTVEEMLRGRGIPPTTRTYGLTVALRRELANEIDERTSG